MSESVKPWGVKTIKIDCTGADDWITAEIFDDERFSLYLGDGAQKFAEDMSLDVARQLRDFLIYAIPKL